MIRVVLVDDHSVVRCGFAQLLSFEKDIKVVGEFESANDARNKLSRCNADVCVLDISLQDENGLDLLKQISKSIACIMLSVHDSATVVEKSLNLGAKSYLSKRCSPDDFIKAVRLVSEGKSYLPPDIRRNIGQSNVIQQLSKRERQVCEMLTKGLDVKGIAEQLKLSPKTIHIHRANAMDKLNVCNNVELANTFRNELI